MDEEQQPEKLHWFLRAFAVVAAFGLLFLVEFVRVFDPEFDPRKPRT